MSYEVDLKRKEHDYYFPSESEENSDVFEVESILNHKIENGKMLFLIKWKGFGDSENTWENASSLECYEIISEYIKKNNHKNNSHNIKYYRTHHKKADTVIKVREIQKIYYGEFINGKLIYHVKFHDGKIEDISSLEMKLFFPKDLLKFLEETSF